jgi:hypothetical protein
MQSGGVSAKNVGAPTGVLMINCDIYAGNVAEAAFVLMVYGELCVKSVGAAVFVIIAYYGPKDCRNLRDAISEIHANDPFFLLPRGDGDGHSEAVNPFLPGLEGLQRSAAAAVGPASAAVGPASAAVGPASAVELNPGFRVGDDGFIEENSFEKNLFADSDPHEQLSGGKYKRRYTKRQRNNRRRTKKNKKMTKRKTNKKKYI